MQLFAQCLCGGQGCTLLTCSTHCRRRVGNWGTSSSGAGRLELDVDYKLSLSENMSYFKARKKKYPKNVSLYCQVLFSLLNRNKILYLLSSLPFFLLCSVRSICILSLCDWHVCARGFLSRYFPTSLNSVLIFFCFPESFFLH